MNGNIIAERKNELGRITIGENLEPALYLIRVIDKEGGTQWIEKMIKTT